MAHKLGIFPPVWTFVFAFSRLCRSPSLIHVPFDANGGGCLNSASCAAENPFLSQLKASVAPHGGAGGGGICPVLRNSLCALGQAPQCLTSWGER